jgi:2-hydroxy-6-oxonona-2,4-dienedioate hydrolase/2-succinyl-6-hydroxy-2,4-cyclohexadiene-1-carboxylate synthase
MPIVAANGVNLHYLQAGRGPDMIMLHGFSGNLAVWHLRMVPMLQDDFRVTTIDLRGHGHSSMPPSGYTTRDMAHDLLAFMDAMNIEQADLVGHSYGADIVLHFALLFPHRARKLVLIEPGIPALVGDRNNAHWEGWANWADVIGRLTGEPVPRERWGDIGYMLRRSIDIPIVFGPARGLPRRKDRIVKLMETTTVFTDYVVVDELTVDNLATIPHAKLLIYDGGSAWLSTFRVLRNLLTNCTSVILPGSELGHFAPLDAPEVLVEHLNEFMKVEEKRAQQSAVMP